MSPQEASRTSHLPRARDIDEQQWPINVALVLLGAFVLGVVVAVSDFSDPRLLYNGWVRLIGVGATLGLLAAGMIWMRQRILRRVQLGVLLSLLFHLVLAFYLHQQYLQILAEEERREARQEQRFPEPVTMPDYHWEQIEQPEAPQPFDRPVPTEAPADPATEQPERKEVEHTPPVDQPLETPATEPSREQPDPAAIRRAERSAPRRAEQAAGRQISRQKWQQAPVPNEPVPEPTARRRAALADRPTRDRVATPQRRATDAATRERRTVDEPAATRRLERIELARQTRQPDEPSAREPSVPRPQRQATRPSRIAETAPPAPTPVRRPAPAETERLQPSPEQATRRLARQRSTPSAKKQPLSPAPVTRAETGESSTRRRLAARQPEPSGQTQPTVERAVRRPTISEEPTTAELARQAPRRQPTAMADVALTAPERQTSSRAASGRTRPSAAGMELPAMTEQPQLPSAVARRAQRSQPPTQASPDVTASRPSTLKRNPRGIALPSSAVTAATDQPRPTARGATATSRLQPNAESGAVTRSEVKAPASPDVAAAGSAALALGQSQITTRLGQRRATGRREPSAEPNSPAPRIARSPSGESLAAFPVPNESEASNLAAAATTGGPPSPTLDAATQPTSRSGGAQLPRAISVAGAGPAISSGTSGRVGVAEMARVSRNDISAESLAGGGTPRPKRSPLGLTPQIDPPSERPPTMAASGGGGRSIASPLQARIRGTERQVVGLPGRLQSSPASGAPLGRRSEDNKLPIAAARRAKAGQPNADEPNLRPDVAATIARSTRGIDVPAIAEPAQEEPASGAGGAVASVSDAAAPSSLEPGTMVGISRSRAAAAPASQRIAAAADAELSAATGIDALKPGRLARGEQRLPTLGSTGDQILTRRQPRALDLAAQVVGDAGAGIGDVAEKPTPATGQPGEIGRDELNPARIASPGRLADGDSLQRLARSGPDSDATQAAEDATPGTTAAEPRLVEALVGRDTPRRRSDDAADDEPRLSNIADAGALVRQASRSPLTDFAATLPAEEIQAARPIAPAASDGLAISEDAAARSELGLPTGAIRRAAALGELPAADSPASIPASSRGPRRLPAEVDDAPTLAAVGGGPPAKSNRPGLARGLVDRAEAESIAPMATETTQRGGTSDQLQAAILGELGRQQGGLPVQIAALEGPGGLSFEPSLEVGLPSRRARRESNVVHTTSRRFIIERSGGTAAIDGLVSRATPAFQQRSGPERERRARTYGGTEGTERAVEMGLDFLARVQFPDGHWSLHELPPGVESQDASLGSMRSDTAATGLALLAYLGAGYTHLDDKHRDIVDRGIDWLVRNQQDSGDLFAGGSRFTHLYSHGIATIALCEAYGMTQDPELREPARKAVQFIADSQHPSRGGWRYELDSQGRSTEADTSVSGWQLMALKSAQMAGLEVPPEVLDGVDRWLDLAEAPDREGQFVYNPFASATPQQQAGRQPNLAMTAEGMLMRMYLGTPRADAGIRAGADYLLRNLPAVGTRTDPRRDCYYWYYATQAMFQMQDDYWTEWNERLRPLMRTGQVQQGPWAGSWHPMRPVPDRWGHAGGRLYVSAMHLLMLETYYRHLPLFQELVQ